MFNIFGDILRRLQVLEAAILGRASEHFDRKIFKAEVALREGRTTRDQGWQGRGRRSPGAHEGCGLGIRVSGLRAFLHGSDNIIERNTSEPPSIRIGIPSRQHPSRAILKFESYHAALLSL
jgi:hypothetical protein